MMQDKAKQEPRSLVWWDINTCPVPDGYDARMVRHCIESALNKEGFSGPLTITAIGHLSHTKNRTPHVLPAIFSTGIILNHNLNEFRYIHSELSEWARNNQPPATLMLVSGADASTTIFRLFSELEQMGYTTLLVYPKQVNFPLDDSRVMWPWETLLKDARYSEETRRHALEEKCCETVESAWYCAFCTGSLNFRINNQHAKFLNYGSFEDFTTHLKTSAHNLKEMETVSRPISRKLATLHSNATMVSKQSKETSFEEEEEEEEEDEWDHLTV